MDFDEEEEKKKKWTIRMDVTMDKEMTYENAQRVILDALRSAGMKGHCGGIA